MPKYIVVATLPSGKLSVMAHLCHTEEAAKHKAQRLARIDEDLRAEWNLSDIVTYTIVIAFEDQDDKSTDEDGSNSIFSSTS